jgi:hypothetical protein
MIPEISSDKKYFTFQKFKNMQKPISDNLESGIWLVEEVQYIISTTGVRIQHLSLLDISLNMY